MCVYIYSIYIHVCTPNNRISTGNVGHQRGLRRCGGRPQQHCGAAGAGDPQVPCTFEGRIGASASGRSGEE